MESCPTSAIEMIESDEKQEEVCETCEDDACECDSCECTECEHHQEEN